MTAKGGGGAHQGSGAGQAHRAATWSTAITATTDERVFVRGVALDDAIGRESFPAMLLRLWRGDAVTDDEAELMGACLVASIDHGPLSPSALVTRTIASTRAAPMSGLAGGILAFGELHGAVVSRAMRILGQRAGRRRPRRMGRRRLRARACRWTPPARHRTPLASP